MGLFKPTAPDYDLEAFPTLPWHERVRLLCLDWVHCGFGAPISTYGFCVVKALVYAGGWWLFVRAGGVEGSVADWWATPIAFLKAVLWTMLFEMLGLGCGSGPLTGRYWPPFAAIGHYLRPGTIRLPPFPVIPGTAGTTRSLVDVLGYAALVGWLVRVLLAGDISATMLVPVAAGLPLIALRDKQLFLVARGEHYWTTVVVFLFLDSAVGPATAWSALDLGVIAGAKAVQLSIWWWAATSKLNHHFPYVVAVMLSNHPVIRSQSLRRALFRGYPDDLRPGLIPTFAAHGGTVIEYAVPLLLVLSSGGLGTTIGLTIMVCFHLWIFSNFALGVPQEWNVFFIYSALVLFGNQADVKPWQLGDPLLWAFLLVALLAVQLVGSLLPQKVSFLPSMRYYAGNWATSTWLFRPEALERFDRTIPKASGELVSQLRRFFDEDLVQVAVRRALGFRAMHLHGRLVQRLICRAVDDPDEYVPREGELVAGMAIGWNFGDGHLHFEQLVEAVQRRCGFAPGDVRVVMVESQPFMQPHWDWRIIDAAEGRLASGRAPVAAALEQQPWPEPLQAPPRRQP